MKTGDTIIIDGRRGLIVLAHPVTVNNVPALRVDVEHNPGHRYHPQRVEYYLPLESEDENGEEKEVQEKGQSHQEEKADTREAERVPR